MAEVFCGCSGGRLGKPGNIPYEEAEVIISSQHYAQSLEVGEFPKFLSQKRARARERERELSWNALLWEDEGIPI